MTDLPEIAKREMTNVEKAMTAVLDKSKGEWNREYDRKINERLGRLNMEDAPTTDATVDKPIKPKADMSTTEEIGDKAAKAIQGQIKIITSSRFSIAGMENSPAVKVAAEQLAEQKRTNELLGSIDLGGIA